MTETNLMRLAKRDNNKKRPYLLVNPLQGKHIPCSPSDAFALFSGLAEKLYASCQGERLLIIGFAETATAIGAALAACSPHGNAYYLPTTREEIPGGQYLFFSETHSHATEQKLLKNRLPVLLSLADRIVFAEDEVTTGNTILNAIEAIRREYADETLSFGVASILNGMSDEALERFHQLGIPCVFLRRLAGGDYEDQLSSYQYDPALRLALPPSSGRLHSFRPPGPFQNPRLGGSASALLSGSRRAASDIIAALGRDTLRAKRVLVLGTEEFMFPPLCLAAMIEKTCGCASVRFHATTRSPILPSAEEDYPLHRRFQLRSVYDPQRTTYIYNLTSYDKVVLFHDSDSNTTAEAGLMDLTRALNEVGCDHISSFRWEALP